MLHVTCFVIILGIDPGTTRIGYGVIKKTSNKLECVDYGIIAHFEKDRAEQIRLVNSSLSGLIKKHRPEISGIEKLFFFKNQKTIISVSEMRGVLLASLALNGVPIEEFTPLQIKQAVSGYGRAGKDQVQQMVKLILGLKTDIKPDDAADGLAIAICCANSMSNRS